MKTGMNKKWEDKTGYGIDLWKLTELARWDAYKWYNAYKFVLSVQENKIFTDKQHKWLQDLVDKVDEAYDNFESKEIQPFCDKW